MGTKHVHLKNSDISIRSFKTLLPFSTGVEMYLGEMQQKLRVPLDETLQLIKEEYDARKDLSDDAALVKEITDKVREQHPEIPKGFLPDEKIRQVVDQLKDGNQDVCFEYNLDWFKKATFGNHRSEIDLAGHQDSDRNGPKDLLASKRDQEQKSQDQPDDPQTRADQYNEDISEAVRKLINSSDSDFIKVSGVQEVKNQNDKRFKDAKEILNFDKQISRAEFFINRFKDATYTKCDDNPFVFKSHRYVGLQKALKAYCRMDDDPPDKQKADRPAVHKQAANMQAIMRPYANMAIRSMQREFSVALNPIEQDAFEKLRDRINGIDVKAPDATQQVIDALNACSRSPYAGVRHDIAPDTLRLYRRYMHQIDHAPEKSVSDAYVEFCRCNQFHPTMTIESDAIDKDVKELQERYSQAVQTERERIDAFLKNPEIHDQEHLRELIDHFTNKTENDVTERRDIMERAAIYPEYMRLFDEYVKMHPQSEVAGLEVPPWNLPDPDPTRRDRNVWFLHRAARYPEGTIYRNAFRDQFTSDIAAEGNHKYKDSTNGFIKLCNFFDPTHKAPYGSPYISSLKAENTDPIDFRSIVLSNAQRAVCDYECYGKDRYIFSTVLQYNLKQFNNAKLQEFPEISSDKLNEDDIRSIRDAMQLRQDIRVARTPEQVVDIINHYKGASELTRKYCQKMFEEKIVKAAQSSVTRGHLELTGLDHISRDTSDRVRYQIDGMIDQDIYIGHVANDPKKETVVITTDYTFDDMRDIRENGNDRTPFVTGYIQAKASQQRELRYFENENHGDGNLIMRVPKEGIVVGKNTGDISEKSEKVTLLLNQYEQRDMKGRIFCRDPETGKSYAIDTTNVTLGGIFFSKFNLVLHTENSPFYSTWDRHQLLADLHIRYPDEETGKNLPREIDGEGWSFAYKPVENGLIEVTAAKGEDTVNGVFVYGDDKSLTIASNGEAIKFVGIENQQEDIMKTQNVVSAHINENCGMRIFVGTGEEYQNLADHNRERRSAVQRSDLNEEEFRLMRGAFRAHDGLLNLTYNRENGDKTSENVLYISASKTGEKTADLSILTQIKEDGSKHFYTVHDIKLEDLVRLSSQITGAQEDIKAYEKYAADYQKHDESPEADRTPVPEKPIENGRETGEKEASETAQNTEKEDSKTAKNEASEDSKTDEKSAKNEASEDSKTDEKSAKNEAPEGLKTGDYVLVFDPAKDTKEGVIYLVKEDQNAHALGADPANFPSLSMDELNAKKAYVFTLSEENKSVIQEHQAKESVEIKAVLDTEKKEVSVQIKDSSEASKPISLTLSEDTLQPLKVVEKEKEADKLPDIDSVLQRINDRKNDRVIEIDNVKSFASQNDWTNVSVVIEPDNDLRHPRVCVKGNRTGEYALDPKVSVINGEYFMTFNDRDGKAQQKRIASVAMGNFSLLDSLSRQPEFSWAATPVPVENLCTGTCVTRTYHWHGQENGKIQDMCQEHFQVHVDRLVNDVFEDKGTPKYAEKYALAVYPDGDSVKIQYLTFEPNVAMKTHPNLRLMGEILDAKDLPTPENAASAGFVSMDFDSKIAIKKGGEIYQIRTDEETEHRKNWVDPQALDNTAAICKHSALAPYQDPDKPYKRDARPIVNQWEITPMQDGKVYLTFMESGGNELLGKEVQGKPVVLERFKFDAQGNVVATFANPSKALREEVEKRGIKDPEDRVSDTGAITVHPRTFTVNLGMPTERQAETMNRFSKDLVGNARDHMKHYMGAVSNMITLDMSNWKENQKKPNLFLGEYYVVKNPCDKLGVIYRIDGNCLAHPCGGSDGRHHPSLSLEGLMNKETYRIDIPASAMRYINTSTSTVYASVQGRALEFGTMVDQVRQQVLGVRINDAHCRPFVYEDLIVRADSHDSKHDDKEPEKDTKAGFEFGD